MMIGLFIMLLWGTAHAATYTAGAGQQFSTIQQGLRALQPGDTLTLVPGEYDEVIDVGQIPSGSSWSAPVTIRGPGAVLKPRRGGNQGDVVGIGQAQRYIVLDQLTLDASHVPVMALRIRDQARFIRVQQSVLRNAPQNNCMNVNDPETQEIEILQNDIYGCGADNQHHGIYIRGSRVRIIGNRIHHNSGHGVHLFSKQGAVHDVLVQGNAIYANGSWGILLGSGVNNRAVNNLVYGNGGAMGAGGIRIGYWGPRRNQVLHNTIYANASHCVMLNDDAVESRVLNNICWRNGDDRVWWTPGTGDQVGYTLTDDPRLIDPAQGDLRLKSDSPAIDVALRLEDVPSDFAGVPRPQSQGWDYGAYEYGSPLGPGGGPIGGVAFGPLPPPTAFRLVR